MTLVRKAARLPSIARDGWRYPALRVRARGEDTAVEALDVLGLPAPTGEFEQVAMRIYAQLAESAREAGDELAATRAAGHSESSEEGKKLLYLSVRALRPRIAVAISSNSRSYVRSSASSNPSAARASTAVSSPRARTRRAG